MKRGGAKSFDSWSLRNKISTEGTEITDSLASHQSRVTSHFVLQAAPIRCIGIPLFRAQLAQSKRAITNLRKLIHKSRM